MTRHPIDVISLTAGMLTIGAAVLLMRPDADVGTLWQFAPVGLVAFGLALLVSAVTRGRHDAPEPATAAARAPTSRSTAELTEEDLIRDSLGHFGADMVDGTVLFDRAPNDTRQAPGSAPEETSATADTGHTSPAVDTEQLPAAAEGARATAADPPRDDDADDDR